MIYFHSSKEEKKNNAEDRKSSSKIDCRSRKIISFYVLPSCSSVWFTFFFLPFPPELRMSMIKEQIPHDNKHMSKQILALWKFKPELCGNRSWTKFAREQRKILASLHKEEMKSMIQIWLRNILRHEIHIYSICNVYSHFQ